MISERETQGHAERSKIFKDASQFFDQISNATSEPTDDVIVDTEVIKTKNMHAVKTEVRYVDDVTEAKINDIVGEIEFIFTTVIIKLTQLNFK